MFTKLISHFLSDIFIRTVAGSKSLLGRTGCLVCEQSGITNEVYSVFFVLSEDMRNAPFSEMTSFSDDLLGLG